jgi:hypothetical protein
MDFRRGKSSEPEGDQMKINGEMFIDAICNRLKDENRLYYNTTIISKLKNLDKHQLTQLTSFGDVTD